MINEGKLTLYSEFCKELSAITISLSIISVETVCSIKGSCANARILSSSPITSHVFWNLVSKEIV